MDIRAALLLFLVTLTACAEPFEVDEDADALAQPIVNGQVDGGDPAVVALIGGGNFLCTGTLIRPTVVLTAAHCVPPNLSAFGVTSYQEMSVYFGSNLSGTGSYRKVIGGWTNPGWSEDVIEYDIALLRLDSPGPATPIPFNTEPMSAIDQGQTIRILGFGMTGANQYNTIGPKREAETTIGEVYSWVFTLDSAPGITCNGDSGGTTLMVRGGQEMVIGIHSRSDCESQAIDTRVDEYDTEIYAFLGETPGQEATCDADGQCAIGCGAPDPDCPCADDGYCTAACNDLPSDPDCGCGADGQCNSGCPQPDPDCGACPADGICDPSCSPDVDCGDAGADGAVWEAGGIEETDYDAVEGGGCSVRDDGNEQGASWLVSLGVAALLGRRRRRRRTQER